jgi:hypothetical protein
MTPGLRKVLLFGVSFIPLFVLFLWLYPNALPTYERVVIAVANPCLGRLSPPLEVEVNAQGDIDAYALMYGGQRQPIFGQSYRPQVIYVNLVLLPALLLATPVEIRRRFQWLVLGLSLLFILHVLTMIVLLQSYQCLQRDPSSFPCFTVHGLALTSGQVMAVVAWALLTWSYWFPKATETAPLPKHAKTGRNDACPCGSGRKYKRCCGA